MIRLRDPETGCPWDVAQDFTSIAPYTIEEAYEVADAIERQALALYEQAFPGQTAPPSVVVPSALVVRCHFPAVPVT